jgi:hypothetical protein
MTNEEKFEELKTEAIKNYENYISAIKNFSYSDTKNLNKRLLLLDFYNKSIHSNAAYRNFLNSLTFVPSNI